MSSISSLLDKINLGSGSLDLENPLWAALAAIVITTVFVLMF